MKLRRSHGEDLGEAISMEDAISMLTIVFVLFVIFLVPLVSIDKARLEQKLHDKFWIKMVHYLDQNQSTDAVKDNMLNQYGNEFDIFGPLSLKQTRVLSGEDTLVYLEYLTADSTVTVIRHNKKTNLFNVMRLSQGGTSTTYQHGELKLDRLSNEWILNSEIENDFAGSSEKSKKFKTNYRNWRKASFPKEKK